MSYLDDSVLALAGFEGNVAWMYLDTYGNVTVGVGKMLPDAVAAARLPFRQKDGSPAVPELVFADFSRVVKMVPGKVPHYYFIPEAMVLSPADVDALLKDTVRMLDQGLAKAFPAYSSFPDAAKLGMLDMGYNLGITRLQYEYRHFCASARIPDFKAMARQCDRDAHDPEFARRNAWTRNKFLEACTL